MLAFFCLCITIVNVVFSVDGDEVKSISVMEGDSVTLHTNVTQIQTDDQIQLLFESHGTHTGEIMKWANLSFIYDVEGEGRFKGKLKLNNQTGSLTITNISIADSGLYELKINTSRETSYERFNVTVYAPLTVPDIIIDSSQCFLLSSSSKCVLLCSVLNVRDVSLSWYKGNSLLSSISVSDLNIRLSLPLEVKYQDTNTYSCVLNNPITNQTQHLNINEVCQTCSEHRLWKAIVFGVIIAIVWLSTILAVAIGVIHYNKKERNNSTSTEVNNSTYTEVTIEIM
ncbi:natural killer cell receptor 2B4-like [Paramisgurnus dabryanus]|uniref:natural killer cell receptor 2B4-like n=1 Tax=Paramisgurnus dabryanus TaxID=90735 RepID=UPI003CCF8BE9